MSATTMTEANWDTIMPQLLVKALPASRMTRKYPFVVAYSPLKFQGLGMIHPFYS